MLSLNFYKIRTGLDIRPLRQGGDAESQLRYDQIIETISGKASIEYIHAGILHTQEKTPRDLGAYKSKDIKVWVLIFGIDKDRSSWTASDLKTTLGNMKNNAKIKLANPDAKEWIGGAENNISCEAAMFDLRTKKSKK